MVNYTHPVYVWVVTNSTRSGKDSPQTQKVEPFPCISLVGEFGMDQTVSAGSEQEKCIASDELPPSLRDPEYKLS